MLNKFVNAAKGIALAVLLAALQACSLFQPAPEIIDTVEPGQQPIAEALLDQYQQGLELMQQQAFAEARAHWQAMLGLKITPLAPAEADADKAEKDAEVADAEASQTKLQHALTDQALADNGQPAAEPVKATPLRNQQGIAYLTDARQLPGVWLNLALSQYYLQQYLPGLDAIKQALAVNAEFCPAFNLQGLLQRENGAFKEAEASYLKALACAPDNVDAHYNLGILYDLYLHDLFKALTHYQQADALLKGTERENDQGGKHAIAADALAQDDDQDSDSQDSDAESEPEQSQQAFLTTWIADLKRRTKDLVPPQPETQPETRPENQPAPEQQIAQQDDAAEPVQGELTPQPEADNSNNNFQPEQVAGE